MGIHQGLHNLVIQPDNMDSDSPCYMPPDTALESWPHRQPELDGLNRQIHLCKP